MTRWEEGGGAFVVGLCVVPTATLEGREETLALKTLHIRLSNHRASHFRITRGKYSTFLLSFPRLPILYQPPIEPVRGSLSQGCATLSHISILHYGEPYFLSGLYGTRLWWFLLQSCEGRRRCERGVLRERPETGRQLVGHPSFARRGPPEGPLSPGRRTSGLSN